jgi:hypothetical protein
VSPNVDSYTMRAFYMASPTLTSLMPQSFEPGCVVPHELVTTTFSAPDRPASAKTA